MQVCLLPIYTRRRPPRARCGKRALCQGSAAHERNLDVGLPVFGAFALAASTLSRSRGKRGSSDARRGRAPLDRSHAECRRIATTFGQHERLNTHAAVHPEQENDLRIVSAGVNARSERNITLSRSCPIGSASQLPGAIGSGQPAGEVLTSGQGNGSELGNSACWTTLRSPPRDCDTLHSYLRGDGESFSLAVGVPR